MQHSLGGLQLLHVGVALATRGTRRDWCCGNDLTLNFLNRRLLG